MSAVFGRKTVWPMWTSACRVGRTSRLCAKNLPFSSGYPLVIPPSKYNSTGTTTLQSEKQISIDFLFDYTWPASLRRSEPVVFHWLDFCFVSESYAQHHHLPPVINASTVVFTNEGIDLCRRFCHFLTLRGVLERVGLQLAFRHF